ncbi:MAG: DNA polymerase III subunit delta' [Crocinitomicaceae bacterium]|nr:DNA polymerase III subunit delta' [Crocinitomicaceae bacterium]
MEMDQVIGQGEVKNHLMDAVKKGRIAHAQLFTGKKGTGGLALALAYAQAIVSNYATGEWDEAGDQSAKLKAQKMVHPDIHYVFPVNKTDSINPKHPVSDDFIHLFRSAVIENPYLDLNDWYNYIGMGNRQGLISVAESGNLLNKLSLKPFESKFKVLIIWMPECMNISAANKILKILEEPPKNTLFILVTEDTDQLLPTIISRTQIIKLDPLTDEEITDALVSKFQISREEARGVTHLASGNYQKAIQLLQQNKVGDFNRSEFITWMRLCFTKDVNGLMKWSGKMGKQNRENLKLFFEYGLHVFRESLILNYSDESLLRLEGSEKEFALKFAPFINQANCIRMVREFETGIIHVQRNANAKILLFDISIQVMKLIKVKPVEIN